MPKTRFSKSTPWGLGLAVGLGLVVTLSASVAIGHRATVDGITIVDGTAAQAPVPHEPQTTVGSASFDIVGMDFSGSLYDTEAYLSEFTRLFNDQGLGDKIGGFKPRAVIVLTSAPVDDQATGYIGFTVPHQMNVGAPLRSERLAFPSAVSYNHAGTYEQLCPIYYDIEGGGTGTCGGNGCRTTFPVVLELIDDPRFVSKPRTRMVIPLQNSDTPA